MLHVFFVHSPITYLVCKATIESLGLHPGQVLLLVDRGMKVDETYKSFTWHYKFKPDSFPSHLLFYKSYLKLYKFDKEINTITNNKKFKVYIPQTSARYFQLLISHKNCQSFNFIEEGTASYYSQEEIIKHTKPGRNITLYDRFCYLGRIKNKAFYRSDYEQIYCLFNDAFPNYRDKVVLNNIGLHKTDAFSQFTNSTILVLDAVSVFGQTSLHFHLAAVLKLVTYLKNQGIDKVYYKLHPSQEGTVEAGLFDKVFQQNEYIKFYKLEPGISLEELAFNTTSIKFYINISSVGLYASSFGSNVYSFSNYLTEFDVSYKAKVDAAKKIFKDKIVFLN